MTARSQSSQQANSKLNQWLARNKTDGTGPVSLKKLPEGKLAPLSFGQLRLWFLQKLNPGNPFYHYAELYTIKGPLRKEHFISCFKKIVSRHEILRTTFPENEGTPWQQINESLDPEVLDFDLRSLSNSEKAGKVNDLALQEATRPFDLINGPLIRLGLLQMDDQHFQLILIMHHIIGDQWSMDLIRQEWASLYQGEVQNTAKEYRYVDFAHDQRQQIINEANLQYWSDKLAGDLPSMEFPLSNRYRNKSNNYKGSCHRWNFSSEASRDLQQLGKDTGTTMFVLMLSIFKVLLFRLSGESDTLVATPVSNRKQQVLETMIGFFNETIILRDRVSGDMTFLELAKAVQATVLEAFAHDDIPFESIVKTLKPDRIISTNPLFQVMFLYHKNTSNPTLGSNITWEHQQLDIGVSKFDLTLHVHEDQDQLKAMFEYAHDLFEPEVIEKMQHQMDALIAGVVADINLPISKLPLLSTEERSKITTEWNHAINNSLSNDSITDLIEISADKYPEKNAVVSDNWTINYAELDRLAGHYSLILLDKGIGKGDIVGIFAEKSTEMIIGLLAVLKTGAAYVPLDADYPPSRLDYIIKDATVSIILTQEHLTDKLSEFSLDIIPILKNQVALRPASGRQPDADQSSIAYIMYTSGSTGQPKGVTITHGNLLSSTLARSSYYPHQPGSFLLMSSVGFDSSVAGIFWTLCSGGTLVLPQDRIEQDMLALSDLIERHQITHTLLLPSLYNLLLQHGAIEKLRSLNTIVVAGESCSTQTCINHFKHLPELNLYNEYGPTEATVWSTVHHIQEDDLKDSIPIGRPIENSRVYLLDQNLDFVPAGLVGEIYICGQGVSSGYLNQPELNESRFMPSPFDEDNGRLMYKTGDLGRYRSDGVIEYLGRADTQIKLRGFRIETDEINNTLMTFPGVNESVVAMKANDDSDKPDQATGIDELVTALDNMDPDQAEKLLSTVELVDQFNYIQQND